MQLLSANEAAEVYGCSVKNIYYLVSVGTLKPERTKPLLLERSKVEKLAASNLNRGGQRAKHK